MRERPFFGCCFSCVGTVCAGEEVRLDCDNSLKSWHPAANTSRQWLQVKLQKLLPLMLASLRCRKCSLHPLPNASVLGDAAMTKAWHCYIGIVHPVDGIGRCLSLKRLPPSTSQLWPQQTKNTPEISVACIHYIA